MPRRSTFALSLALVSLGPAIGRSGDGPAPDRQLRPVLEKYCIGCHGAKRPKAGVDLSKLKDEPSLAKEADLAIRVAEALTDRTMPPKDKPAPGEAERQAAADAIRATLESLDKVRDPGPSLIQRLTRRQYNNTIRDLLGVDTRPADAFPSDGGGGGGFDNNASTLFVPPILMEKYLAAATEVLDRADPARWRVAAPGPGMSAEEAARRCVAAFAPKAFRRPTADAEVGRLLTLYRKAVGRGEPFDAAVKLSLRAALVSPHFLFLVERGSDSAEPYRIGDHELAARLSYFLWSSMPDAELSGLAARGTLHEPDVLDRQVARMLADGRSRALATDFAAQWLRVNALLTAAEPDRRRFPTYTAELRDAMAEEPIAFFEAVLKNDCAVTDLLSAEYTYLNETMAKHYGIDGVAGPEFRKVALKDRNRGGVLGMAAILTLTSYPQRTSPVLRGKWVLEEVLGTPAPPPPDDVKVLPADDRPKGDLSFRQRLEQHRKNESCAACHARLDPLGFGLERFDAIGRWRDEVGGRPVDSSGKLTSGESFDGPAALKAVLVESKTDVFVKNLASRLLSYGLRRGLDYPDGAAVRQIVAALEGNGYRSSVLVAEVVKSYPFQYRRNEPVRGSKP